MADGTRDNTDVVAPQRLSDGDWAGGRVLLADTGRYSSQGGMQTGRSAITDAYNRTSASGFTPRPEQPIPDPAQMSGAPKSKDENKPPAPGAVGSTGTQIFGGIVAQTQEYNEDFYWRAAIDVYEQMRRTDAQVAAILTMLYLPIERADWDIVPASDDPADVELASFVKSALFDDLVYVTTEGRTVRQAWQSIVQQVLTMLPFGFSVFAKWWRIDEEGFVKLARLEPILQRTLWRWWPGADNQLVGVQQRGFRNWQIVYEDIHADALLLFVNRQEGSNYDGWSVLRAAYKHWYYLDVFYRLQGIGIEKHTFMPPIGMLGPLANSQSDADALFEQVKNIRTADSNGIVIPHGSSVEFPKGLQRGQGQEMEFAIHHHDDKIARAVLASFVSMGSNETGTYALADVLVRTFYDTLQGVLEYICGVFNAELIPQLVNYNFRGVKIYPKLTGGSVRRLDMGDITALLPYLNGDPQLEDWLRKLVGAPMAPKSAVNTTNPSGGQPDGNGQRPRGNDLSGGNGGKNAGASGTNDAGDGTDGATGEGADGGADGDGGGGGSALSEVALLTDALASLGLVDAVERAEAHGRETGRTLLSNPYPRGPHGQWGEGGEHGMHSHVGKGLKGHGAGQHEPEHARGPHEGEKVGGGRKAGGGGGSKRGGGGSRSGKGAKTEAKTEAKQPKQSAYEKWKAEHEPLKDQERVIHSFNYPRFAKRYVAERYVAERQGEEVGASRRGGGKVGGKRSVSDEEFRTALVRAHVHNEDGSGFSSIRQVSAHVSRETGMPRAEVLRRLDATREAGDRGEHDLRLRYEPEEDVMGRAGSHTYRGKPADYLEMVRVAPGAPGTRYQQHITDALRGNAPGGAAYAGVRGISRERFEAQRAAKAARTGTKAAKAEKQPAEDIHARAARLQREGGLREEARPGSKNPVLDHEAARGADKPYSDRVGGGLGARGLARMYGEHALGSELHGYSAEKLNAEAKALGIQPGRTKAETVSRITSHVTEGRYSANFAGAKAGAKATAAKSASKSEEERHAQRLATARATADRLKADYERQSIFAAGSAHSLDRWQRAETRYENLKNRTTEAQKRQARASASKTETAAKGAGGKTSKASTEAKAPKVSRQESARQAVIDAITKGLHMQPSAELLRRHELERQMESLQRERGRKSTSGDRKHEITQELGHLRFQHSRIYGDMRSPDVHTGETAREGQ